MSSILTSHYGKEQSEKWRKQIVRVASKICRRRKSERKVVRCMINVNKSIRYWPYEEDIDDSFKILPKIKDRRKVQDLIDAYINKSRFVWKTVTFFWGGKNIFQKSSPNTSKFSKISPNGRSRTRTDAAPLMKDEQSKNLWVSIKN
jgi:hypothetical protein